MLINTKFHIDGIIKQNEYIIYPIVKFSKNHVITIIL